MWLTFSFASIFTGAFAGLLNLTPIDENIFPQTYVQTVSGQFQPGGLVAMQLQKGVSLRVDGAEIKQDNGLIVFGFGRDAGEQTKLVFSKQGKQHIIHKPLLARTYETQYIEGVAPEYVTPPPAVLQRIKQENALKRAARRGQLAKAQFTNGFQWPLTGRMSGVYGSQRIFNGQPRRPHFGVDIVAAKGTPVKSMADGKVTLAQKNMYYEGGLVFIDHGLDIISAYLHLSEISVKRGDRVRAGDMIGRVGSGGRSTGAHLDWRVYWRDKHIDPVLLVGEQPARDNQ
ncbi:MAG: M23 family metallopeptidase [Alphaproteobacteria bacterium]|nr:M23 family metallopeptidase [Alphaproteobacteria bacterium]